MTANEFLDWIRNQDQRHDLVDGVPVALGHGDRRHDSLVVNAIAFLRHRVSRLFSGNTAVLIPNGNIRYPDTGVDSGRFLDDSPSADAPVLVIEVLRGAPGVFEMLSKVEDYRTVPSLGHVLILDPDRPRAILYSRDGRGWASAQFAGSDAVVALEAPAVALPLSAIYQGLTFTAP